MRCFNSNRNKPLSVVSGVPTTTSTPEFLEWAAMAGGHKIRRVCVAVSFTHVHKQYDQAMLCVGLHAPSAAWPRNPVLVAVALLVVLGSRTVEMPATQSLTTHGLRGCRLANVGCGGRSLRVFVIHCGQYHVTDRIASPFIHSMMTVCIQSRLRPRERAMMALFCPRRSLLFQ